MTRVDREATGGRGCGGHFWRGPVVLRDLTVNRFRVELVVALVMVLTASSGLAADSDAVVHGIVRDVQGVAQMGVLVQVLTGASSLAGSAYTDMSGRYRVAHLTPGRYQIKASAALFAPAVRNNLVLPVGARSAVDLTLVTMFESTAWLPAERRRADEPSDDWRWTLRSSASRPILRLADDDIVLVSSSATEQSKPEVHATAAMTGGDGGFGLGGVHHRLTLDETLEDGSDVVLRADMGTDPAQVGRTASSSFAVGYQRRVGFAGDARTVINFQSHPEMRSSDGAVGLAGMRLATAQRMKLGDVIDLEYGSSVSVVRVVGMGVAARPFVRVLIHPVEGWSVGYRMATSRELQAYDGLDSVQWETPVAAVTDGRVSLEQGVHQEVGVSRVDGRGSVQVAVYHDNIGHAGIAGTGIVSADDLQRPGVQGLLVDSVTDNFRLLSGGYAANGVRVTISEPLTQGLYIAFSLATGEALTTRDSGAVTLQQASQSLRAQQGQSLAVAVKGRIDHTGTKLRAAYRWQPRSMVTSVDPYGPFSDQAFLSFYVAQPIRCGGLLPHGVNAVADVTNVLGQGYQQLLSQDSRSVFLAQSPRVIQAGLSYTF